MMTTRPTAAALIMRADMRRVARSEDKVAEAVVTTLAVAAATSVDG